MPLFGPLIKLIVFAGSIKVFKSSKSPFTGSSTYTFIIAILGFLFGDPLAPVLFGSIINVGLTYLYFRLLNKFEEYGLYWVILVAGLFIPFWDIVIPIPF